MCFYSFVYPLKKVEHSQKSPTLKQYLFLGLILFLTACNKQSDVYLAEVIEEAEPQFWQYGFNLYHFDVHRDTVRPGDTFSDMLLPHGVSHDKIMEVASDFKDSFDVRRIRPGKPYVLLKSKDSLNAAQVFIYENNALDYSVIDFRDKITISSDQKPVCDMEREASGEIKSSLSATMAELNLSPLMTDQLSKIYAWTIDFFRLQEGDRFKVIYTERFIDDTISAGLKEIKAAYFEHRGKPLYAFQFETDADSTNSISGYYDEEANNLRRAFLKAPVEFSRISSRYNLNRRIK